MYDYGMSVGLKAKNEIVITDLGAGQSEKVKKKKTMRDRSTSARENFRRCESVTNGEPMKTFINGWYMRIREVVQGVVTRGSLTMKYLKIFLKTNWILRIFSKN